MTYEAIKYDIIIYVPQMLLMYGTLSGAIKNKVLPFVFQLAILFRAVMSVTSLIHGTELVSV